MPLNDAPVNAEKIAVFSDTGGNPAKLRYDVPLPGQYRGRRVIALEGLKLADSDWRVMAGGVTTGVSQGVTKQLDLKEIEHGQYSFDERKAEQYFLQTARANGVPGDMVMELERHLATTPQVNRGTPDGEAPSPTRGRRTPVSSPAPGGPDAGPIGLTPDPDDPQGLPPELLPLLQDFKEQLHHGTIMIPQRNYGGSATTTPAPIKPTVTPRLALVEMYAISSFLGDYGLGRTVKTMSLLPGEELTMRLRTWRSSERSVKESSSIFDSATSESKERFQSTVQAETTDKHTQTSKTEWHVDANVVAAWGWGAANVTGGGSGEYHSGREQFGRQVNDASQEHARESSNKRDVTVSSSTERTDRSEDEETIERVIRNVNLRRTLNFVFRELNQTYDTYVHLLDVKVGYSDGTPNSWREVPLSGLRQLLEDVLVKKVDETAKAILDLISVVFDESDSPQQVLERFTWQNAANTWLPDPNPTRAQDGSWAPPTKDVVYRYKRGKIGQNIVDGVLMRRDQVVLRTDSVLVEALLGQADALDEYAMVSQRADAEAKTLANDRAGLVNAALQALDDAERATAYAEILNGDGTIRLALNQGT